ncbi:MAG: hypothetical protein AAB019_01615 [Planctomycetota bacterium]
MSDGLKKIVKCTACPAQYNVAQFAPGTKFKCQKCGAVNIVPVPSPPPVVPVFQPKPIPPSGTAPQRRPSTPPVQIPAPASPDKIGASQPTAIKKITSSPAVQPGIKKPLSAMAGRPALKKTTALPLRRNDFKTSKSLRKPVPDKTDDIGEDNGLIIIDEKKKSKKKLFLIIGITGGVIIITVIMALLGVFSGKVDKDSDEEKPRSKKKSKKEEIKTEELSSKGEKKLKSLENWKPVEADFKKEVSQLLKQLENPASAEEGLKIKKRLLLELGKKCMPAIIECFTEKDESIGTMAQFVLEKWLVKQEFSSPSPGTPKPPTFAEQEKDWKLWWLNNVEEGAKFSFPESAFKDIEDVSSQRSPPGLSKLVKDFPFNENLKPEVELILKELGKQTNREEKKASTEKLKNLGEKEVIPILITIILNHENEQMAFAAESTLREIAQWQEAPMIGLILSAEERQRVCAEWQRWWIDNKEK